MKSEKTKSPRASSRGALIPAAWLLIAVAAPGCLIWFNDSDSARNGEAGSGSTLPEQALAEHRAGVQEWLGSYGWVDRERGIARVPIEEGMKTVLREGLPAREAIEEEER